MNEEQIPAHVEDSFNRESRGLEFDRVAFFRLEPRFSGAAE